ncbi:MAG: type II toxin-antitoxin system RelE/ParE family toxin [Rhodospirillales bacterium]
MTAIVHAAAKDDILAQVERYVAQGLPAIAQRFAIAAQTAIDTAVETPESGLPHIAASPALAGLRTRPIKGFTDFAIYFLASAEQVLVLRVLHAKRQLDFI